MKKILLLASLLFATIIRAQMPGGGGGKDMMKAMKDIRGRAYGKIIDAKTKKPVEYAQVVALWFNKDSILGGGLTGSNGEFNIEGLPPIGNFRLRATQIGYKTFNTKFFIQIPNKLEVDLGDIAFEVDEKLLNEVEVSTQKQAMVLSIDKRTYNVDKDISVKGGTAVDVMKNVPGVTVDADGNAQLRNQSPTIFVDGRPSNLTLQQIPADQIERIEVITNPSVKYDANTTGGILNIVMKKNLKPGYNGMAMAYIGTGDRYGGMVNLNVKEGKWNFTSMYSYNQAINPTLGYTRRSQLDTAAKGTPTAYFNQDNKTSMHTLFNFGKIGADYSINNRNTLSLNGMIMGGRFKTTDNQSFAIQDKDHNDVYTGKRVNNQNAAFQNYNAQLLYKKTYPKAGKELTADLNYNYTNAYNYYLFTTYDLASTTYTTVPPVSYQRNDGTSKA
ncbi:MAG: TonB-dependent receptor, partial [Bacteroidia bacterium]|nr:TonB-dependent receptor [Bacteroidia bacterium]